MFALFQTLNITISKTRTAKRQPKPNDKSYKSRSEGQKRLTKEVVRAQHSDSEFYGPSSFP